MSDVDESFDRNMARIEVLVRALEDAPSSEVRDAARELAGALLDVHGIALERMFTATASVGAPGQSAITAWRADPRVTAMLALHGLEGDASLVPLRLARTDDSEASAVLEPDAHRCELCGAALGAEHMHLYDESTRELRCACSACAPRFVERGGRLVPVPRLARELADFRLSDDRWRALDIPIDLAFFSKRRDDGSIVVHYPGPAGTISAPARVEAWSEIARENPVLSELEPEVTALLVNRLGPHRDHFIVSIDRCFELAGVLKSTWRGLGGGPGVAPAVDAYFEKLRASCA